MGKLLDVKQGDRYGIMTILNEINKIKSVRYFNCKCDCGTIKTIRIYDLINDKIKSCGCLKKTYAKKHGHTTNKQFSSEYYSWMAMKQRCTNPNNKDYKDYGGRGIKVCDRWLNSFEKFFEDMGERPKGTTIERLNFNGNYEPINCEWATKEQQNRNRRNVKSNKH